MPLDLVNAAANTMTALAVVYASRQLKDVLVSLRAEIGRQRGSSVTERE